MKLTPSCSGKWHSLPMEKSSHGCNEMKTRLDDYNLVEWQLAWVRPAQEDKVSPVEQNEAAS